MFPHMPLFSANEIREMPWWVAGIMLFGHASLACLLSWFYVFPLTVSLTIGVTLMVLGCIVQCGRILMYRIFKISRGFI